MLKVREREKLRTLIENPEILMESFCGGRLRAAASLWSRSLRPRIFGREETSALSPLGEEALDMAIYTRVMGRIRSNLLMAPSTHPEDREIGEVAAEFEDQAGRCFTELCDEMEKGNGKLEKLELKVRQVRNHYARRG